MKNYVIINGVNSNTINGLAINELPPITKPPMRVLQEEIDGRDGDITTNLGYGAYDKVMTIGLFHTFDINQIIAFFNGTGTIVFSNEPDKKYNYKIIEQIDYEKLISFKTATVTFHCQPFKYPVEEEPIEVTYTYVEGEGETLTLTPTSEAPMEIDLKGNTSQYTTTGKNKFSTDFKTTDTLTTYTKIDNNSFSYTCSGTWKGVTFVVPCKKNTDYFFNYDDTGTTYCYLKGTQTNTDLMTKYHGYFHTFNSGENTTLTITISNGNHSDLTSGTLSNIQLEEGTSTTSFEKYSGGIPAPNPSYSEPVNVVTGDNSIYITNNLFIKNNVLMGFYVNQLNGELVESSNRISSEYINVKANTSYIFSNANDISTNGKGLAYYNNNKEFISGTIISNLTNGKFTTPSNCKYILFSYDKSGDWENLMLNEGENAIPYQSQTYPIYLGGKNKIPTQAVYWEQGGINASTGTNTESTTRIRTKGYYQIKNNTDYYVSIQSASYCFLNIILYNSSKSYVGQYYYIDNNINGTRGLSINIPSSSYPNVAYMRVILRNSDNTSTITANEITTIKPQIELGTSATSFVEYNPIELCKIGDYQDYIRKSSGKNLFNKTNYVSKDGTIGFDVSNLVIGQTYTLSTNKPVYLSKISNSPYGYNSAQEQSSLGFTQFTFTMARNENIPEGETQYIFFQLENNVFPSSINDFNNYNIQIEKGNQPTFYEPYGIVWYVKKQIGKVVFNGSEEGWSITSSGDVPYYRYRYVTNALGGVGNCLSNYFKNVSISTSGSDLGINITGSGECRFREATMQTIDNFKNWLSTHNTIVYYVLATPTNTIIEDTELIGQLDNIQGAMSYKGQTNIMQVPYDKPFILKVKASKDDSGIATINNIGNIYSKPTIALEGNGTGGIYLNDNQILSVELTDKMTISISDMEAFDPDTHALLNRYVTGNYNSMTLQPNENTIKITGGITKATITDYTRWL